MMVIQLYSIVLLFLTAHSFVLSIEPARVAPLALNDTFRVSVNIGDAAHLYGYNFSICFDSLVLEALAVNKGTFLSRFGSTFWIAPTIKPGKVENAAEALIASPKSAYGSGTLATVKFKVKGTGSSALYFYPYNEIQLSDADGSPLPWFALLDAWYGSQSLERGTFNITPGAINHQELPSATWFTPVSRYVVIWQDKRNGTDYNIWAQNVNSDGTLYGSALAVCDSTGNQMEPAIAYNPTGGLFTYALGVWTDYRRGVDSADIYGRLFYKGGPVSAAEFAIAKYSGFQDNPGIARCGGRYMVVWQDVKIPTDAVLGDSSVIYSQLLTYQGSLIGSPIRISPYRAYPFHYNLNPSIAGSDSAFLIVWSNYTMNSYSSYELQGRLVDTLGNLGSVITIASGTGNFYQPSCAFDGVNYLVVWTATMSRKSISGKFISKSGTPGTGVFIYQSPDSFIQYPRVSFNGLKYLIVWDEKQSGTGIDYIRGCFVSTSGEVGTPFTLCTAPYQQTFPFSTYGGSSIVVWQDYRNGTDYDIWGYLGPPIGIEERTQNPGSELPELQVFPNPFKNALSIKFQIPMTKQIPNPKTVLKIYDATGRFVKSFSVPTAYPLVPTELVWDGTDDSGRPVESGVYFVKFGSQSKKFLFLK